MRILDARVSLSRDVGLNGKAGYLKPETRLQLDSFFQNVAQAPTSLLMLDYDGTLAPFTTQRDQAFPYPGVQLMLRNIMLTGRTRVVIISGRDVRETESLLHLDPSPEIWGLHGLQHRMPNGITNMSPLDPGILSALSDADRWLTYQNLRETAEFKTGSIAVHWRGLPDSQVEERRGRVLLGWKPIAESSGLELLDFDGGIEICPRGANKGEAVRSTLRGMGTGSPAAYLGDDLTDERGFAAIRGHGLSILVRPQWRRTQAQLWLQPPKELLHFFTRWLQATGAQSAAGDFAASAAVNP